MELIYRYDPTIRNLSQNNVPMASRSYSSCNIITLMLSEVISIIPAAVYYFSRYFLCPENSIWIADIWQEVFLVYSFSCVISFLLLICLFGFSKSGFLQILSFLYFNNFMKEDFEKSKSLQKHLRNLGIVFALAFPFYLLALFNYTYMIEDAIIDNPFFQFREEVYYMDKCKGVILQYYKNGREGNNNQEIRTEINIINENGKQLKLTCDESKQMTVAEKLFDHAVPLIKPDMTEEEFYSVLDWNGEEFLQFYYPELWEQYGIPDEN